jgi:hypothetical protein
MLFLTNPVVHLQSTLLSISSPISMVLNGLLHTVRDVCLSRMVFVFVNTFIYSSKVWGSYNSFTDKNPIWIFRLSNSACMYIINVFFTDIKFVDKLLTYFKRNIIQKTVIIVLHKLLAFFSIESAMQRWTTSVITSHSKEVWSRSNACMQGLICWENEDIVKLA